jgi:hypothetical protein
VGFIGILILGCAIKASIALAVERPIPDQLNGITAPAAQLSRA